ncbi:YfiR family protein [Pseudodesulfovibrio sp.]|uniref:YfiR family protein n=1 Tax=Pseudodesulfovibrio sp. TaxID=2035812 RepID=UPI00261BD6A1|nr:YfiR family protein [Pseudodesulfovibrio sp.]MDD3311604.1 YfiR family protein [Pseudodesulfovibrio sp.]
MVRSRVQATFLLSFALLLALALPSSPALAGGPAATDPDQLEALFVQRLTRYVTWPEAARPGPDGPVIVAATDARRLRPYFADLPPGRFRLVQWPADEFHVLIVNGAPGREAAAILRRAAGRPVLTIGQGPESLRLGAVIAFRRVGGHIRLEVNPRAAARSGLSISSRLLSIVRIYGGAYE